MTAPATAPALQAPSPQRARAVVVATLVAGGSLLALALRLQRGSAGFYVVTLLVAVTWTLPSLVVRPAAAVDGRAWRMEAIGGAVVGGLMFGVFVAAAVVGRHFSFLADPIDRILRTADGGALAAVLIVALVNAVAEELFFRNTLVVVLGPGRKRTFAIAIALYVAVTAVSGNTALTLAAVVMGLVFAVERRCTGAVVTPIATHLVWSTLMILAFPR